jgi:EAL domain-containing protein (putative c-di-GMP-specific phosphodiesterase class I)
MVGRRDYASVINAIVQLAHNLGIEVVAEGVETKEQVAMLLALDCDLVQGYLYARPLSAKDAFDLVCSAEKAQIGSMRERYG